MTVNKVRFSYRYRLSNSG